MNDYIAFFQKHPVFRLDEFKAYANQQGRQTSDKNCQMALYYHCKKGALVRIRKGLYAVNNPYNPQDPSPLAIAGKATDDAVLAYHSALESHGVAYTDFNQHVFLANQSPFSFKFQGQHYHSASRPMPDDESVELIRVEGVEIKRTNLARTLVDVLDRTDLSGGWEEVWRSLDQIISFDADFSVDYALSLGKASLIAKLGYFLDQRPKHLSVESSIINRLLAHIPKQPYYINRDLPKAHRIFIKRWSIVIPRYLHYREWEEPEFDSNV